MRIHWPDELVTSVDIVPRLEDHLIDELFYQEDEIGEMRHTAFMVECGLEEDPPDGPDVDPVPWGYMLLNQQRNKSTDVEEVEKSNDNKKEKKKSTKRSSHDSIHRKIEKMSRTLSTDDFESSIGITRTKPTGRTLPRRANSIATTNVSIASMLDGNTTISLPKQPARRKVPKQKPPNKASSNDDIEDMELSLAFAKTNVQSKESRLNSSKREHRKERSWPNVSRKLSKTRSGTSHTLRVNTSKLTKSIVNNNSDEVKKSSISHGPPAVRSLVCTKSGTLHGMRKKLQKEQGGSITNEKKELKVDTNEEGKTRIFFKNGKKTVIREKSNNAVSKTSLSTKKIDNKNKEELKRLSLNKYAEINGKNEKVSIVFKNGSKTIVKSPSRLSSATSDNVDFLNDIISANSNSTTSSDISISSDESDVQGYNAISSPQRQTGSVPKIVSSTTRK